MKFIKECEMIANTPNVKAKNIPPKLENNRIIAGPAIIHDEKVMLEEFVFLNVDVKVEVDKINLRKWFADKIYPVSKKSEDSANDYWNQYMQEHIAIVSDEIFGAFVKHFTPVNTRNRINNATGTADDGALFTVEYLPEESILYCMVLASEKFGDNKGEFTSEKNIDYFNKNLPKVIQMGGNATIGKGIVEFNIF